MNPFEKPSPGIGSETPAKQPKRKSRASLLSAQDRQRILELHHHGYGSREIARRVSRNRKTVRKILLQDEAVRLAPASPGKLDRFRQIVQDKVRKRLTSTRILREIRSQGYTGGRTILTDYVRSIRSELKPQSKVKRRFETRPAEEMQVDWSVYTVPIAGSATRIHALACELAYSRKAHVRFYLDERQPTLLEGLTLAFEAFTGVAQRVVFDNMATVVLGRIGPNRKPLWHPRFVDFFRYYAFEPFLCRVRDPDRKGKDEKFLRYLEEDFVRGSEFSSFEDLNERARIWLDETANPRTHGTTGLVPDDVWLSEREFLIRLPEIRFAVHEDGIRQVGPDSTLWIRGTPYTVPAHLANRPVAVRLYAEHFEVMDGSGRVGLSRRYVEAADKGKLQIDPAHYAALPRRESATSGTRLDELFLRRFPLLAPLVVGIARQMKSLAHVHLRALWRLADLYGEPAFLRAAARAQDYRRFNAEAVRRILERDNPPPDPPPVIPLSAAARTLALLSEVDPASLDSYAHLDKVASSPPEGEAPPEPAAPDAKPDDEEDSNEP